MGFKDTLSSLAKYVTGEAIIGASEAIKDTVDYTVTRVIKASALFLLFALGFIFALIGLAQYLQAVNLWTNGMGLLVVGGVLVGLGVFVNMLK